MRCVEAYGQRYNPPGPWPESSRGTGYGTALRLDTKARKDSPAA